MWGARSFYLTGCFINVIKHGRALWLCIIADLHSRGKGRRKKSERRAWEGRASEDWGRERAGEGGRDNKDMRLAG